MTTSRCWTECRSRFTLGACGWYRLDGTDYAVLQRRDQVVAIYQQITYRTLSGLHRLWAAQWPAALRDLPHPHHEGDD